MPALTSLAVFPVRSFTAKGIYFHEPIQGLNLNRRSISGLEPEVPVTTVFNVCRFRVSNDHASIFCE